MDKRTEGAWLVHHTKKLLEVNNASDFEEIELAGKCGIFLSNLAASDEQSDLNSQKVLAIAKVSNVKKTELDTIKNELERAKLIEVAENGSVSVLGVTTASVLTHTTDIFNNKGPSNFEKASLELAENVSDLPKGERYLKEYFSDNYKLPKEKTEDLFAQSEEIGFIDFEKMGDDSKFYFNGNLFRKERLAKVNAVLGSLTSDEQRKILELDSLLSSNGCVTLEKAKSMLGDVLLSKLQSIGMYDFSEVSNSREARTFVTKPSAFSKYGNPFEEDALDLAKAFVSSLYYGMNYSTHSRGRIWMLKALMRKLLNGYEVGPATAIGEDYKILELKRVIELRREKDNSTMFYMKLLKKDVGELAMQVLETGDSAEQTLKSSIVYSGSVTDFQGPEQKRVINRKKQNVHSKNAVAELLRTFRANG